MHITTRVDYAVRALVEIAGRPDEGGVKADTVARAQAIPAKVLETVFAELRRAGLVHSRRGPDGGYWLARPAAEITVADVIRAVEGPLASVRGEPPEDVTYSGSAESLQRVWIAVRVSLRTVLEGVSIGDIASGDLPGFVFGATADPKAWQRRDTDYR